MPLLQLTSQRLFLAPWPNDQTWLPKEQQKAQRLANYSKALGNRVKANGNCVRAEPFPEVYTEATDTASWPSILLTVPV